MPKPNTPFVGCDLFTLNSQGQVLLIRRTDNGLWALPGGAQDLGETPAECAIRETYEESGYQVVIAALLGVYSSERYEYLTYPWPENRFTHLLFAGDVVGGAPVVSEESSEIAWFAQDALPALSDGHPPRIVRGFEWHHNKLSLPHFE